MRETMFKEEGELIFGVNKTLDWTMLKLPEWVEKHKIRMRNLNYAVIYLKGFNRIEERYLMVTPSGSIQPGGFALGINFKLNFKQPKRRIL